MTDLGPRNPMLEKIKEKPKRNFFDQAIYYGKLSLAAATLVFAAERTYHFHVKPGSKVLEANIIEVEGGQINPSNIYQKYLHEMENANLNPNRESWDLFKKRFKDLNEGNVSYQYRNGVDQFNFNDLNKTVFWPDIHPDNKVGNMDYKTIENKLK